MNIKSTKKIAFISIIVLVVITVIGIIFVVNKRTNIQNEMTADLEFQLDNNNKYEIITDFKWMTMQDDGGSNTSICY